MTNRNIIIDNQYHKIKEQILNNTACTNTLFDTYGERCNHLHFINELIVLTLTPLAISNVSNIAFSLIEFTLEKFEPLGYGAIPFMQNSFQGEILYTSHEVAFCKISSLKFPGFGVIISIVDQIAEQMDEPMVLEQESQEMFNTSHQYCINGVASI